MARSVGKQLFSFGLNEMHVLSEVTTTNLVRLFCLFYLIIIGGTKNGQVDDKSAFVAVLCSVSTSLEPSTI